MSLFKVIIYLLTMGPRSEHILYLVFTCLSLLVVVTVANYYVLNHMDGQLHDISFEMLPNWSGITVPVPNYLLLIQVVCILFGLRPFVQTTCQIIFVVSVLQFVRAVTIVSTMLPLTVVEQHSEHCKPTTYLNTFLVVATGSTCGDYLFSGHMATSVLFMLFTVQRTRSACCFHTSIACTVLMPVALILMRWHYTDDILIGLLLSTLFFLVYDTHKESDKWFYFAGHYQYGTIKTESPV